MGEDSEKKESKFFDCLSDWECKQHKRHPLVSQIITRAISAFLVIGIGWWIAQAKAFLAEDRFDNKLGAITITNKGLLPLNATYSVVSDDTSIVIPQPSAHVNVYPSGKENIDILEVKNLPASTSTVLQIKGPGSATVKDVGGNTVLYYPISERIKKIEVK